MATRQLIVDGRAQAELAGALAILQARANGRRPWVRWAMLSLSLLDELERPVVEAPAGPTGVEALLADVASLLEAIADAAIAGDGVPPGAAFWLLNAAHASLLAGDGARASAIARRGAHLDEQDRSPTLRALLHLVGSGLDAPWVPEALEAIAAGRTVMQPLEQLSLIWVWIVAERLCGRRPGEER